VDEYREGAQVLVAIVHLAVADLRAPLYVLRLLFASTRSLLDETWYPRSCCCKYGPGFDNAQQLYNYSNIKMRFRRLDDLIRKCIIIAI